MFMRTRNDDVILLHSSEVSPNGVFFLNTKSEKNECLLQCTHGKFILCTFTNSGVIPREFTQNASTR